MLSRLRTMRRRITRTWSYTTWPRIPWEQKDVAGVAAYASIRRELLSRLYQHLVETKDPILQGAVTSPQHRRAVELLKVGQSR